MAAPCRHLTRVSPHTTLPATTAANRYRVIVMRRFLGFLASTVGAGILVVAPVYLGVLLLVLLVCLIVGLLVRTRAGQALVGHTVLEKLPGYTLFRSLTLRIAGKADDVTWKPALAEIEEALVPAFIIEEFADGRYTVFVPSVPTPLAGAVYVLTRERVHPVSVGFAQAFKTVSRWGAGAKDLVAAMEDARQGVLPGRGTAP